MGALLTAFVLYAGCEGNNAFVVDDPEIDIILAQGFALNDGESYPLNISVVDEAGSPIETEITWETSDESIVTISAAGVITAHHPGTATVSARARGRKKSTTITVRRVPVKLELVSGDGQQGAANAALDQPVVVRLIDRHDEAVPGVTVDFDVLSGGGSITPASAQTNANGVAQATWTLGASGTQQVESVAQPPQHVSSIGSPKVTFNATVESETPPPPPPDDPSRVTDLRVTAETQTSVTVAWTAVGDGAGGTAKYALRYGSPTIQWQAAVATEVNIPAASQNGATVSYTYSGLAPGTTYQFQVVAYRGTLNQGAVFGPTSNTVTAETDATPAPTVATVTATPSTHTFTQAGATRQVTATARDAGGNIIGGAQFSWRSTNTAIVTVSNSGLMTAVAEGNALVIVTSGSVADTVAVTVDLPDPPAPPVVASVTASPSSHTFTAIGATRQVTATAREADGDIISGAQFSWRSTNTSSVTVSSSGLMTSVAEGTALVIVTSGNVADTVTATVDLPEPPPPPVVASVTASPSSHTFTAAGATRQVTATARDADGDVISGAQFSWRSTNTSSVTVSSSGLMTSVAEGTALVIVTSGNVADTVTATVDLPDPPPPPSSPSQVTDLRSTGKSQTSVTLAWTSVSDGAGGSAKYAIRYGSPTIQWQNASATERTVGAAAQNGATVTYSYTGLTPGTTYQFQVITYRGTLNDDAVFGTVSSVVTVTTDAPPPPQVATVTASPSSHTFTQLGAQQQITATARDGSGNVVSGVEFNWSSTNPSVVSVNNMGRMTANAAGTALIIVTAVCCNAADTVMATVDVQEPPPPPPGSGPVHPNEPSGLTLVGEYDWRDCASSGQGLIRTQTWTTRSSVNNDHFLECTKLSGGGPLGSGDAPTVVRHVYPRGAEGGGGNELIGPNGESGIYSRNFSEVYIRYYVRVNSTWDGHSSGINKMVYVHDDPGDGFSAMWYEMKASGSGPLRVYLVNQSGGSPSSLTPSPDSEYFKRGQWHLVEIHQNNAARTIRMWVDGKLAINASNVGFRSNRIRRIVLTGIWGGVGDSKATDDYMDFAYVRISGR